MQSRLNNFQLVKIKGIQTTKLANTSDAIRFATIEQLAYGKNPTSVDQEKITYTDIERVIERLSSGEQATHLVPVVGLEKRFMFNDKQQTDNDDDGPVLIRERAASLRKRLSLRFTKRRIVNSQEIDSVPEPIILASVPWGYSI